MAASVNRDEWAQTIERYNQELMAQYARVKPSAPTNEDLPSIPEEDFTNNDDVESVDPTLGEFSDIGYLQVRITTENQAIPLPGAIVTVTHDFGEETVLDITEVTDQNGQTSLIPLATKDRTLSLSPGNVAPYASYTVEAVAEGYFTKRFESLPIYGGVTAFQNISMIPLPEAGDPTESILYPAPKSPLS